MGHCHNEQMDEMRRLWCSLQIDRAQSAAAATASESETALVYALKSPPPAAGGTNWSSPQSLAQDSAFGLLGVGGLKCGRSVQS